MPRLGSLLRTKKELVTAEPAQPESLRPAPAQSSTHDTIEGLIRNAQYQPGQGPESLGPPLPPHTPSINSFGPLLEGDPSDAPFAPADLSPQGRHYLDRGPAVSGELLARERAVTATERALELSRQLEQARDEKAQLQALVEELQKQVQDKSDLLDSALKELAAAKEELARSQSTVDRWAAETIALRKRMEERERAHEKSFNELVELINTMIDQQKSVNNNASELTSE